MLACSQAHEPNNYAFNDKNMKVGTNLEHINTIKYWDFGPSLRFRHGCRWWPFFKMAAENICSHILITAPHTAAMSKMITYFCLNQ